MEARRADAELIPSAMAYVEAVHRDLTAENTALAPGVEGRVVSAILADPALSYYVETWASRNRLWETNDEPPPRPAFDAVYERVRELLRRAGDESGQWP